MKRVIIAVLDSFGIGYTRDAIKFGDMGADTFGHIAQECALGYADMERKGPLHLPNLSQLGLQDASHEATGRYPAKMARPQQVIGAYGYASELSTGKDTPSGHWEIAGVPVLFEWDYFTDKHNSFPPALLTKILNRANLPGYYGNCHSSGTVILDEFGEQHMQTGLPIFYTSADSVFQIACHEQTFGLENLYQLCQIAREELNAGGYNIGRVIARPFVGDKKDEFKRTGNRKDLAVEPPAKTVLQKLIEEKQGTVVSVGKISDIYAHVGISKKIKATGLEALFDATLAELSLAKDNTIVFTNFVDFDASYGHRRDVAGYAAALEYFDTRLPELLSQLKDDDIFIVTADHGCDPVWHGTDHTREYIPVLVYGHNIKAGSLGHRETFADIGQSIADYFGLSPMDYGTSIFSAKK